MLRVWGRGYRGSAEGGMRPATCRSAKWDKETAGVRESTTPACSEAGSDGMR
jgi:hypothetical protein